MSDLSGHISGVVGCLQLNTQLLLLDGALRVEPISRPGEPLEKLTIAVKRESIATIAGAVAGKARLQKLQQEFAASPDGWAAADAAFYGIEIAFQQLGEEIARQGIASAVLTKRTTRQFVVLAFGWGLSIEWWRYANTLNESKLTVTKWDRHPPFPGVLHYEQPRRFRTDTFTFGLVAENEPAWTELAGNRRSYSSSLLAERFMADMMKTPNDGWRPG